MENENKLGVMPISKLIWNMSLPIIASMLVQALYNVVDSIFVSHVSESALTAVSLAFSLQNVMIAVGVGTGVGVNALLSKSLGEKNQERANKTAENGIFLSLCSYASEQNTHMQRGGICTETVSCPFLSRLSASFAASASISFLLSSAASLPASFCVSFCARLTEDRTVFHFLSFGSLGRANSWGSQWRLCATYRNSSCFSVPSSPYLPQYIIPSCLLYAVVSGFHGNSP